MASSPKSKAQRAYEMDKSALAAKRMAGKPVLQAHSAAPTANLAIEDVLGVDHPHVAGAKNADASMLQDIDAILSRLDDGIAKERKAMDNLLERIRQPAA